MQHVQVCGQTGSCATARATEPGRIIPTPTRAPPLLLPPPARLAQDGEAGAAGAAGVQVNSTDDDGSDNEYQDDFDYFRRFRMRPTRDDSVMSYISNRPKSSALVHEALNIDTQDQEDHTFSGIMFNVSAGSCKEQECVEVPLDFVLIESVWVRGALGPMSVYFTKEPGGFESRRADPEEWTRVYQRRHAPSFEDYAELKFDTPVQINAGEIRGVYVHSERPDDQGVVYDNTNSREGDVAGIEHGTLVVHPFGMAHLNERPFYNANPWGHGYGNGFRANREFVGRFSYGVKWLLWNPEVQKSFPPIFREVAGIFITAGYRQSSVVHMLPQEIVLYIINMCTWNHFGGMPLPVKAPVVDRRDRIPPQSASHWMSAMQGGYAYHFDGGGEQDSDDSDEEDGSDVNDPTAGSDWETTDGSDDDQIAAVIQVVDDSDSAN